MTELALVFSINVLTSFVKRWVYPKWGKTGTQVLAFVLALIGAMYYMYLKDNANVSTYVSAVIGLFSIAVAFYETILSKIPVFKGE